MSVEAYVIAALVDEGSPKRAFQEGIDARHFEIKDEEFEWIVERTEKRKPITPRLFKQKFPEFEFIVDQGNIGDLLAELKQERAFVAVSSAIDEIFSGDDPLSPENAVEKAFVLREILGEVARTHSENADISIKADWERAYERVKRLSILNSAGESIGIPTGLDHFDHHFGGLLPETSYLFLGRPGDAKSFTLAKLTTEGAWAGFKMGFFSPEMTEHQHNCRFHTLLSAKKEVQAALSLKGAFRNRALKNGFGFNLKEYRRFLQWLNEEMKGEIKLFTQKYRREKMSVSYIESRVEDYGLDAIVVDPIYKLRAPRKRGNRWEELGEIVDALVDLSHTYNIPVVMSNQAGRALQGMKGDPPGKDSSHGADSPVQEANCVIGVKHFSDERIMKYKCDKNRDGEPFRFSARFHPNVGVLEDITPLQGDFYNGYDPEKVEEVSDALREAEETLAVKRP